MLAQPRELEHGAWLISQCVGLDRLPQGPEAGAELLAYLTLGAAARYDGMPLLRPKVHLFVCGLDEMVIAFEEKEGRCGKPPLWIALTARADVDLIQFHDLTSTAAAINIGESLRTSAAQLLDMGLETSRFLSSGNLTTRTTCLSTTQCRETPAF